MGSIIYLLFPTILLIAEVYSASLPLNSEEALKFHQWKLKYGKEYNSNGEQVQRYEEWLSNYNFVQWHNKQFNQTFTVEMNEYADQHVKVAYFDHKMKISHPKAQSHTYKTGQWSVSNGTMPKMFDWRTKGVVPNPRNQGQIGSSIAIAITESVESYNTIKTGRIEKLSVAEVAQCCGTHMASLHCVHDIGGLCSAADYPQSSKCMNSSCIPIVQISDKIGMVPVGDEKALQSAVLITPVIVAIDASRTSFQLYRSGVYKDDKCSSSLLDHAMLLVGYGQQDDGVEYWICLNSWGTSWGMQGYVYIARNAGNMCGIASDASYPL